MENAHLRLRLLEYVRITEKTSARIRLRVDRYMGEDRRAHLLSVGLRVKQPLLKSHSVDWQLQTKAPLPPSRFVAKGECVLKQGQA
jgi:hypothetical protein